MSDFAAGVATGVAIMFVLNLAGNIVMWRLMCGWYDDGDPSATDAAKETL